MKKLLINVGCSLMAVTLLTACQTPIKNANSDPNAAPNAQWADYKDFTKVTEGHVLTGSEGGPLGTVHQGPTGFRDIFVNNIALAVYQSEGPYQYPVGSVVVKEQYKNEINWQNQKLGGLTVMVKLEPGTSPETGDWGYSSSYKGPLTASAFCGGCHSVALADDFLFTNAKKLRALAK